MTAYFHIFRRHIIQCCTNFVAEKALLDSQRIVASVV
jgi:hypothetical protein